MRLYQFATGAIKKRVDRLNAFPDRLVNVEFAREWYDLFVRMRISMMRTIGVAKRLKPWGCTALDLEELHTAYQNSAETIEALREEWEDAVDAFEAHRLMSDPTQVPRDFNDAMRELSVD